jgi:hypothetical protein
MGKFERVNIEKEKDFIACDIHTIYKIFLNKYRTKYGIYKNYTIQAKSISENLS